MIKEYFTDGLLQIAIVLSLLRVDLDSFTGISNSRNAYPEQHEIYLGSLSGFTQTDILSRNRWNAAGAGFGVHPKSIDNFYPESIFRELHSLTSYRTFDGVERNVNAFLVNGPEPVLPCGQRSTAEAQSPGAGAGHTGDGGNSVPSNNGPEVEGAAGDVNYSPYLENDLTKEEMELIEVLWRQDIDLGIGREMFDSSLRQELDKESNFEEERQDKDSKKEDEDKAKAEPGSFPVLDLSGNYVIDGETGELVPGPLNQMPEPDDAMDFLDFSDMLPGNLELPILDGVASLESDLPPLELLDGSQIELHSGSGRSFTEVQQATGGTMDLLGIGSSQLSRQNSLEERWEDVLSLLDRDYSTNYGPVEMGSSTVNPPVSHSLVQNVSLANLTSPEPFLLAPDYSMNSTSFPLFPESDMNITYGAASGQLMTTMNPTSAVIPFTDTNSTFINMNTASHDLTASGYNDLHETGNISEFSSAALESLFQHIFDDNNNTFNNNTVNFGDAGLNFEEPPSTVTRLPAAEETSSDSAISSVGSPVLQWYRGLVDQSDGIDEATGGKDIVSTCEMDFDKYEHDATPNFRSDSPCLEVNSSASSNDTNYPSPKSVAKHIYHNHTYVLQPGQVSREEKEEALRRGKEQKATRSRDEKKAKEMKLPFSIDTIINSPVEDFTQLMSRYTLSESQQQLIRDIRRRGKNKQAAQNCRKRKMDVIQTLEQEVDDLNKEHGSLLQTRRQLDRETAHVKDKLVRLQTELFRSLRDDNGQPYNPNEYSLQQLPDGNLFLVPKNSTTEKAPVEKPGRKRKPKRKE